MIYISNTKTCRGLGTLYGQLHIFLEERENPRENFGRKEEEKRCFTQSVHRTSSISSSSSLLNPSIVNFPVLASIISLIGDTFQASSFFKVKYSTESLSIFLMFSTLVFPPLVVIEMSLQIHFFKRTFY